MPASIFEDLASKAANFDKYTHEVIKHPSVLCIWDKEKIVEGTRCWIGKRRGKCRAYSKRNNILVGRSSLGVKLNTIDCCK